MDKPIVEPTLLENEHPGKMLKKDDLEPLGLTADKLAKETGLSQIHVSEILRDSGALRR